ncbi:NlpC/P60 family protein [Onishia niordana]|uniref:NlpC/P60 family protein n=1 Tax=Onishia niordana TaxID=2508711 RepID=UPI0010A050F0|nr:NlpC/P60 family protein [Halomonas niordiana]
MSRIAVTTALLALHAGLAGCATSPSPAPKVPSDYFATQLPGLSSGPMSPVDNPLLDHQGLEQPSREVVRKALYEEHERWLGTPYRLGGESRHGIDCSALIQTIFRERFDTELPRTTSQQVNQGRRIKRSALKAGDLVFFRPPGTYRHAGIYVGDGFFLHASSSQGVSLSRLDNSYWRRYYWQARRPLAPTQLAQRAILATNG